jgi:hypothetical protein
MARLPKTTSGRLTRSRARQLPKSAALRARRWDVLVLGSALGGLAAAVRLGRGGLRVCVVEEEAAARLPVFLREPFLLPGATGGEPLDRALRELGLPRIERRDLEPHPVAFQVLLPDARVEVGRPALLVSELVSWGLAKPEEAEALVEALAETGAEAARRLSGFDWIRPSRLRRLTRGGREPEPFGPLPPSLATPGPRLAPLLQAWARGSSELARGTPPPDALARLLASALAGGALFQRPQMGLRTLLHQRIEALHGDFRALSGPFRLAELGGDPGVARVGPDDVWLGRALLLNAPATALRSALAHFEQDVPRWLRGPAPVAREVRVHARALRDAVPEPLARRSLLAMAKSGCGSAGWPVSLALEPSTRGARFVELVAAATFPLDTALATAEDTVSAVLARLLNTAGNRVRRAAASESPLWDDGSLRFAAEGAFPAPLELRAGRRPIYRLDRAHVAALGLEGEILQGIAAADAILEDLA